MKLIIISNRLPLKIIEEDHEFKIIHSPGGVSTGLDSLETTVEKYWIGWPGLYIEESEKKSEVDNLLKAQNFYPVYLSPEQIENYYEGYCNDVIWPLCHYFPSYIHYNDSYRDSYREVNSLFCKAVLEILDPEDVVWVQDYHLMLLPRMIRENCPDVSIGYFHHIPFPSYELFRTLPDRADVLNGLLGADLIAFHTHGYMRHFISAVFRVLKLDCVLDEIYLDSRVVYVNAFPMGIHYEKYHNAMLDCEIKRKALELKESFGYNKLILSVDRLDYSKGILIRLKSYDHFLKNHPEYRGKVSLVMVVAPSRDNVEAYSKLKKEIDKAVGSINGRYSTMDWCPVYYFYRIFHFEELVQLYHIADVALVTPLRDGMNLVAKEYLATKREQPGVLILSEMAGAAIELSDSIIVNPTNTVEIENAIVEALELPINEQLNNLYSMQNVLSSQTVGQWASDFVGELKSVKLKNKWLKQKIVVNNNFDKIKSDYDSSKSRLIILDYDGTLVPFHKDPKGAVPPPELLELLSKLNEDLRNHVVISSGRDRSTLESWLGHLPIGLAAEHGAFYKENGIWHQKIHHEQWDHEILDIMKRTVKRTPGSKLEIKDTALVWHYRNVDVWLADLRVTQLINALINPCFRNNLQIMKGIKIVEIKPEGTSKGDEAKRLINNKIFDFIMAIGDDTTDEEMFLALPDHAVTIKVGKHSSTTRYNIPTQRQTIEFLKRLSENKI
ncbi:MAG: bifunctional alpha,alpha-trehalose-phosphate synthase (UDP-forming)/trehalose-phosphatase [Dysgonamonadaceae bacterium]|jgi:trehalose 6-phosphate synthase/phosphatase|nr:bifunctional alpha,alpha-trehalose-phosphate synthase (UDP-forming)/trehalose-phosphatase [Dysgonamonadaceae bacterium]